MKKKKGIERNLLAKKFIKKITYSKENIKIALYYPENLKGSKNEKTSALLSQGGAEKSENEEKNYVLDSENKFVSKMMAPEFEHLRTFSIILPNLIHQSRTSLPKGRKEI
ncbi:hypothetical protein KAI56_00805 [Candidatus Parcubacteria bacterium]|nr:hypothetical protein [Candidatus Parcubacteria bacterium]